MKYLGTREENELVAITEALQDRYLAMGPAMAKIADINERFMVRAHNAESP